MIGVWFLMKQAGVDTVYLAIESGSRRELRDIIKKPLAFERVLTHVKPERIVNRREAIKRLWWRFGWERPEIRKALVAKPDM